MILGGGVKLPMIETVMLSWLTVHNVMSYKYRPAYWTETAVCFRPL